MECLSLSKIYWHLHLIYWKLSFVSKCFFFIFFCRILFIDAKFWLPAWNNFQFVSYVHYLDGFSGLNDSFSDKELTKKIKNSFKECFVKSCIYSFRNFLKNSSSETVRIFFRDCSLEFRQVFLYKFSKKILWFFPGIPPEIFLKKCYVTRNFFTDSCRNSSRDFRRSSCRDSFRDSCKNSLNPCWNWSITAEILSVISSKISSSSIAFLKEYL